MRDNRYSYKRDDFKPILVLSGIGLVVAIITFIIIFFMYNNKVNSIIGTSESTKDVSSEIGRTVNEMLNSSNSISGISTDINNNISDQSNISNQNVISNSVNSTSNTIINGVFDGNTTNATTKNTTTPEPVVPVKVPDPVFKKPVEGKIILEYAKNNLVFSNTLQEWVPHLGIDIAAAQDTIVKASADGTIDSIKNDPRYGLTVIIKHVNGYKTVYANLSSASFVKKGDKVKSGQSIGKVGDTAAFEVADEPHLHFEIIKDNVQQNPSSYLK